MPRTKEQEAFLSLIADAKEFHVEYDADQNSSGTLVDCSVVHLRLDLRTFDEFVKALGFKGQRYAEAIEDYLQREIEADMPQTDPENVHNLPGIRQSIEEDRK